MKTLNLEKKESLAINLEKIEGNFMFVKERFVLSELTKNSIHEMEPNFGYNGFGEFVFYRTYSRSKSDGSCESWNDVVIRVTEGIFSIRKDWFVKNKVAWNETFWQDYAVGFATFMFDMKWMPPGRGLWAMGTEYVYERGSMALQNCGFVVIRNIANACHWIMDSLMNGVGVGFAPERDPDLITHIPTKTIDYIIPDSREGWCDSTQLLIQSFTMINMPKPIFDYSLIRIAGMPIKGFGGVSSGPESLMELHKHIEEFFRMFREDEWYDEVLLKADLANAIGCCVVAGNVRRSAELAAGPIDDPVFMNMKDYKKYPYRADHGWMSNNSVYLEKDEDFEHLDEIARRVIKNGEPGYINLQNLPKGRIGKEDDVRPDKAVGFNPCGEQPLENYELCCLVESLPTRCVDGEEWLKACEYATVYASTVTLLPTHRPETNAVMYRNRRIGVGIIDFTGWMHEEGANKVIKWLRRGYNTVRDVNRRLNAEAGIPEAIRVTTIKPGGTVPKLAGKTSGCGYPTFKWTLRRVRVAANGPVAKLLIEAGLPHEKDVNSAGTLVFEYPIEQGPAKPATEASLWEQACNLVTLQREWSDNAVSNTLYFKKEEEGDIERVLSMIAPLTKSVSLLPHTEEGVYAQMPEQGISEHVYNGRVDMLKYIDWSTLRHKVDEETDKYCDSDRCEVIN